MPLRNIKNPNDIPHVLVVDDMPDHLALMQTLFVTNGWKVDTAKSPNGLIAAVNAKLARDGEHYDALIVDINYFGQEEEARQTGISAIADLREAKCDAPVVFVSGYLNPLIREQIAQVGGIGLTKPIELDDLMWLTIKLINTHRELSRTTFTDEQFQSVTPSTSIQSAIQEVRAEQKESGVKKQWKR